MYSLLLQIFLKGCLAQALEQPINQWSVLAYGGQWSANSIGAILRGRTEMQSSYVGVVGASQSLYQMPDRLRLELEANVGTHFGLQHHSELNSALLFRWRRFPWRDHLNTSVAFGLGPSLALQAPRIEERPDRPASPLLVFMPVELTLGRPPTHGSSWELLLRVHHRSGAYGVVSPARGSNFISLGLRYSLFSPEPRMSDLTSPATKASMPHYE